MEIPLNQPSVAAQLPHTQVQHAYQEQWRRQFNLRGYFIGQKWRNGAYTRATGFVCIVDAKLDNATLPDSAIIPRRFTFKDVERSKRWMVTDVLQKYGSAQEQALLNTGDKIRGRRSSGRAVTATMGAFGTHSKLGDVCITAGHFSDRLAGDTVTLTDRAAGASVSGQVVKTVNTGGFDYCLIRPVQRQQGTSFGSQPISSVYEPILKSDIGTRLFVLARGVAVSTVCRGLYMWYENPRDGRIYDNLIVTDPATIKGDSGGALVDEHYRLWGLLIGTLRFRDAGEIRKVSIYMPAISLLSNEPGMSLGELV